MAKKPTEKQLYKLKNEWLGQFFEEVRLRRKSSSAIMARKGRENQPFFKRSKMCNKPIDNISPL